MTALREQIPEGTLASRFLAKISSLTKPENVRALAQLSPDEEVRLKFLEKSLLDLQANDPEKLMRQLTLRAGRVKALARHLQEVEEALSSKSVMAVFEARTEGRRKSQEAKRLREATFSTDLLPGTGTDPWMALWEAARQFSQEEAYKGQPFPVVEEGAHCVLCQQDLDHRSGHRLSQFEAFVTSTTERELKRIREDFSQMRKAFADLRTMSESASETLKEIRIENEIMAETIAVALARNEDRRRAILSALTQDNDLDADCPTLLSVSDEVIALAEQLDARIKALSTSAKNEERTHMTSEAQELRARKLLGTHEQGILDEIERQKKYAAYGLCLDETRTQSITQKSTAVTKAVVSQRLKESFQQELLNLGFRHVEVELKELGGADGIFYHKLVLTRAPGVELPKVVSEGEQRCLSIAAFFSELSTADDSSGIVFDDPVSSLDFQWRHGVARRLVQESRRRQVIVFTHDVVFLLALRQFAEQMGEEALDQHVRRLSSGTGVCASELPWVALPVKKKVGFLKNAWQSADKLFREGNQDAYEKDAKYLYGLLREAWERAVEEVLLGGVVERYRPSVQTQQIGHISDITEADCRAVERGMTKCSTWLPGHDEAAAARAPVPEPMELKADIEELDEWIAAIRKRRGR